MPLSVQEDEPGRLMLSSEQGPIFTYNFGEAVWKPYLHPLWTPSGAILTGVAPTHSPGHRGLFFGWADVNGVDFWHEGKGTGEVPQGRITTEGGTVEVEALPDRTKLHAVHLWQKADGESLLREKRTLTAHAPEDEGWQIVDWQSEFHAPEEEVTLGNVQKAMGLSYCAAPDLVGGHFLNSRNLEDRATNGRPAEWCDTSGPERSGSRSGGLTIMASRIFRSTSSMGKEKTGAAAFGNCSSQMVPKSSAPYSNANCAIFRPCVSHED